MGPIERHYEALDADDIYWDAVVHRIRNWRFESDNAVVYNESVCEFLNYVRSVFSVGPGSWQETQLINKCGEFVFGLEISTGGWSDNEVVVRAMQDTIFWTLYWQQSRRGGHYVFEVREAK